MKLMVKHWERSLQVCKSFSRPIGVGAQLPERLLKSITNLIRITEVLKEA